eukprot:995688-Amphidinium_carterae.1
MYISTSCLELATFACHFSGDLSIGDQSVPTSTVAVLQGSGGVEAKAGSEGAGFMFIAGAPIGEVHWTCTDHDERENTPTGRTLERELRTLFNSSIFCTFAKFVSSCLQTRAFIRAGQ